MRCGSKEEFVLRAAQTPQSEAREAEVALQMGEEHLDRSALSAADRAVFCAGKVTGDLSRALIHVPCDRSGWCGGAGFPDRACPAGFGVSAITFYSSGLVFTAKAQFMPFQTGEAVAVCVICKMAQVILAIGLGLAVQHRDLGRNIALKQPCEERAGAVGFVRRQSIRAVRASIFFAATISWLKRAGFVGQTIHWIVC